MIERGYAKLPAYQGADFASARAVLALDCDNQRWLPFVFWGARLLVTVHGYVDDEADVAFNGAEAVEVRE